MIRWWTFKERKTAKTENDFVSADELFTQMICALKFWYVYCCHVFFSMKFLNVSKPRATFYLVWWAGPPGLGLYESGLGWWMVKTGCFHYLWSEIFLYMKFKIFPGRPTKRAACLPSLPVLYKQLLIQPVLFIPECYFA